MPNIHLVQLHIIRSKSLLLSPFIIITLMILTIITTDAIYADNNNYIEEESLFDDIEVVESATRLKQKVTETPVSVTIIDREMIEASGAVEVYELLRLVPGYFTYSVWGNQFGVTSHFQPTNVPSRLEVQINGRSVYQSLFDTVDWASLGIDVLDIDHIEVVRGSSAPVYGSNAFLGAINFITKGNTLQKHQTSVRATIGNIGRKNLSLNHSGSISELEYFFTLNAEKNSGFKPLKTISRSRDNNIDDKESLHINLQGSYTPDIETNFKFDIGLGSSDINLPTIDDNRGYSNRVHETNYQKLKWTKGSPDNLNSISVYHNYLQLEDDLSPGLLSALLGVSPTQIPFIFPGQTDEVLYLDHGKGVSERFDVEFEKKLQSRKLNVVFGVGARKDKVKSQYLLGLKEKAQNSYRLFSNLDYRFNTKLNTNIGFLAEKVESIGTFVSPRASINYKLTKNQTIRSSITEGKHAPSIVINDAYSGVSFSDGTLIDLFVHSPTDIKAESIKSYEMAYIHHWPTSNTQLELKVFNEKIDNIVGLSTQTYGDIDQQASVIGNFKKMESNGLEAEFKHELSSIPGLKLRFSYAYIDAKVEEIVDDGVNVDNSVIPKHSGTALVSKKTKSGYDLSTVLQYQSDVNNKGVGIKRVDLRVGKKIKISNRTSAEIDLVVQNAFNNYKDYSVRNNRGMRSFVRMQLDF